MIKKIIIVLLTLSLFACWGKESKSNKDSDATQIPATKIMEGQPSTSIGVAISTLNNPFFVDLVSGIENEANNNSYAVVILDSQNDSAKELNNIEDMVAQGINVLLINPVDSDAAARGAKIAMDANIPVISIDRAVNGITVNSHIASDNVAGGKMAAEFIKNTVGDNVKIVELQGISGSSAARERGQGFNEIVQDNVVVQQVANFDRTQGLNVMENIIQTNTDFNAVFAHNDEMALGALKALEDAGKTDVIIVGFDATDDARTSIANGKLKATVAQQPKSIGSTAIQVANKILNNQTVEAFYPVMLELVQ